MTYCLGLLEKPMISADYYFLMYYAYLFETVHDKFAIETPSQHTKNVDILPASPITEKNTAPHIERAVSMACSVARYAFAVLYGAVAS